MPTLAPNPAPPIPPRTLSTLADDGSRIWLNPRVSPGRFLSLRRAVAYLLIAIFTALPFLKHDGRPLFLLDLATRHFTIFGFTFLPTDTLLLALFMVGLFVTIFFLTALVGRVWCGWACPQTVYLEFVFRPIERFFEGSPGRARKGWLKTSGVGTLLKYAAYVLVAGHLANTFLAYFVGVDTLFEWTLHTPLKHPTGFMIVAAVTGLMLFDFAFFREQTCLVACPYGRFQSVLLDRQSAIISYDARRGEPRGKKPAKSAEVSLPVLGDCIDCRMCVTTCPTGIDIRNGLQMECVNCAQCIDACDAVMTKLSRPTGLIRYASQAGLAGENIKLVRPRTVIYPAILLIIVSAWIVVFATHDAADVRVLRARGAPFTRLEGGYVGNNLQVKIVNRTDKPATYTLSAPSPAGAEIRSAENPVSLAPGESKSLAILLVAPQSLFVEGHLDATILVDEPATLHKRVPWRLIGPGHDDDHAPESDDSEHAPKHEGREEHEGASAPSGGHP